MVLPLVSKAANYIANVLNVCLWYHSHENIKEKKRQEFPHKEWHLQWWAKLIDESKE